MALVATINGVQVHSDKQVTSIINTRVEFTDGSWCDVATGQVVNRGRGEINLGNAVSGSSGETVTEGPKQYQASGLELDQLTADVTVETHRGTDMEVTITGPEDEVKAIRANMRGHTLVIGGGTESGQGGMTIVSRGGRTHIRSGRGIVVGGSSIMGGVFTGNMTVISGGSSGESPTKVTVKVPVGTPISVSGGVGNTHIGDVNGPLTVHVSASGDVVAGRMTDVNLHVQGSGDIRVAEVNGSAVAQVQGSGDITIEGGNISTLSASVMGSGDVTVDGLAQRASLSVMGSGDIRVAHVLERPSKSVMGSGDIRVRRVC
jgi:hypothetical protein